MNESVVGLLYRDATVGWNAACAMNAPMRSLVDESYATAISFPQA
jgi:hypothetical protein